MNSNELYSALRAMGLSQTQITSRAVSAVTDVYAKDNGILLSEIRAQVGNLTDSVQEANRQLYRLDEASKKADKLISEMQDAFDVQGQLITDGAKDTLLLFVSMLRICASYNVDMSEAVNSISYVLYAMLGGQAKRENSAFPSKDE